MMRKIFISGIMVILVSSCMSLNQFVVTPVGKEPAVYSQRFIYSLPQSVIEVKIELEKTTYLPGPYRQFTEKYLGMSQFINEKKAQWAITGVNLTDLKEPDPLQYYSVNLLKGSFESDSYLDLTSRGLVIDPMGMISAVATLPGTQDEFPVIFDLSLKKNHKEKVDTLFKTVIRDTSFVKIPILRKQKEAKTLEQKAEEAANLIIKIRKRKLKLIDGEYKVFPEGQALETAIEELNKTEQEYIALFTGKIYTEKFIRRYVIIPSGGSEKLVFMKFSQSKGILAKDSPDGQPVTLEVNPSEGFLPGLKEYENNTKNTLYFRIPSTCQVRITEAENLLYEGRISVYQAGVVLPLPITKK
jgi:hypothetical protein